MSFNSSLSEELEIQMLKDGLRIPKEFSEVGVSLVVPRVNASNPGSSNRLP